MRPGKMIFYDFSASRNFMFLTIILSILIFLFNFYIDFSQGFGEHNLVIINNEINSFLIFSVIWGAIFSISYYSFQKELEVSIEDSKFLILLSKLHFLAFIIAIFIHGFLHFSCHNYEYINYISLGIWILWGFVIYGLIGIRRTKNLSINLVYFLALFLSILVNFAFDFLIANDKITNYNLDFSALMFYFASVFYLLKNQNDEPSKSELNVLKISFLGIIISYYLKFALGKEFHYIFNLIYMLLIGVNFIVIFKIMSKNIKNKINQVLFISSILMIFSIVFDSAINTIISLIFVITAFYYSIFSKIYKRKIHSKILFYTGFVFMILAFINEVLLDFYPFMKAYFSLILLTFSLVLVFINLILSLKDKKEFLEPKILSFKGETNV